MTYSTLDEIVARNKQRGHHYFDADAMRFFGSKLYPELYGGRFFVTSETPGEIGGEVVEPRYSIRVALDSGEIEDVGEFREFDTLEHARLAALSCAAASAEVRLDPYPAHADQEPNPDHFMWRCWLTPVRLDLTPRPVGIRSTRAAAKTIASQVGSGVTA